LPTKLGPFISQVSRELRPCHLDTALHIATRLRHEAVLRWLRAKPQLDMHKRNDKGMTAAEAAADLGPEWVEVYQRVFGGGEPNQGSAVGCWLAVLHVHCM
jgi:hypothetical protein